MRASPTGAVATGNLLLDALPSAVLEPLRQHLEDVLLHANQSIHEPGETAHHVLFPIRGLISIVAMMEDGASVEVGMVGKEGMYGVSAILYDDDPVQRAMVQLAGGALRMPTAVLRRGAEANVVLRTMLLRYVQVTLTTATQTAACNRLHLLEQRCARWLLSARDRAEDDSFPMTHEFLAMMLAVRRPGVSIAAQALQSNGLISYSHGTMTIIDRAGLEAASCECYGTIRDEFNRLLRPANP